MTNEYLEMLDYSLYRRLSGISDGSEDVDDILELIKDEVTTAFNRGMMCASAHLEETV